MTQVNHPPSATKLAPEHPALATTLSVGDYLVHTAARLGFRRDRWRVEPGLYRIGEPDEEAPVLVTANYRLSVDAVRRHLSGRSVWLLVLQTYGINVWCAAGKGTFGTDELVARVEETLLKERVAHRRLILPQLAGPGVAAHTVKKESGFRVDYGPVEARHIPAYLDSGHVSPEMRRITFPLIERLVLIPVELRHLLAPTLLAALLLWLLAGPWAAWAALATVITGTALVPAFLPFLPSPNYAVKGFWAGLPVALLFAWHVFDLHADLPLAGRLGHGVAPLFIIPAVTAFLALNFTGSTPFASPSGVRREIARYTRPMAFFASCGVVALLLGAAYSSVFTGG